MRFIILSIFSLLLFISCENFQKEENHNIIARDTFVSVLIDMHLTDVILSKEHRMDRNLKDTTGKNSYYNFLYKKYNINEYRFTKTVDYYSHHSEEYSLIYKDVIDELSKRRSDLDSIRIQKIEAKKDSFRLDSIKKKNIITQNDSLAIDSIKSKITKDSIKPSKYKGIRKKDSLAKHKKNQ